MVQLYFNVPGVGNVPVTYDVTDGGLADYIGQQFTTILTIFEEGNSISSTDLGNFQTALNNLTAVTQGYVGSDGNTYYCTYTMASYISSLINSLSAAGLSPTALNLTGLQTWAANGLTTTTLGSIASIIVAGANAPSTNHSLQAMIELEYVSLGNNMLYNQLSGLQQALELTNQVLNALNAVQQVHNLVVPVSFNQQAIDTLNAFIADPTDVNNYPGGTGSVSTIEGYLSIYQQLAAAAGLNNPLGTALDPSIYLGATNPPAVNAVGAADFTEAYLQTKLVYLLLQAPPLNQDPNDPNSLAGQVGAVIATMEAPYNPANNQFGPGIFSPDGINLTLQPNDTGIGYWILDNTNSGNTSSGYLSETIQTSITNAITGAENLNDQQKEQVQNSLYIFQEFYNSASAILGAMNTILTNIARGIAG